MRWEIILPVLGMLAEARGRRTFSSGYCARMSDEERSSLDIRLHLQCRQNKEMHRTERGGTISAG